MRNVPSLVVCAASVVCLSAWPASAQPTPVRSRVYVEGLAQPLAFVQDPSTPRAQYVVQQDGRVRVILDGTLQSLDFLDLSSVVLNSGERGLLGMALPIDYGTFGYAFVNFVDRAGNTVVARFARSTDESLHCRSRIPFRSGVG